MILPNLRIIVKYISEDIVELETEQGQIISMPKNLLPHAVEGTVIFVAADAKPLVGSDKHAKDVLNEIIKK